MILRSIFRLLPMRVRAPVRTKMHAMRTRRPFNLARLRKRKEFSGRHVVVAGIYRSATGIGKAAELVARTLEERGSIVSRVDLTTALEMVAISDTDPFPEPKDCGSIDATDCVVVLNADHAFALSLFDRKWLLGRCIVGHWIWELERLPQKWQSMAAAYDEIWAPTEFVLESIRNALPGFNGATRLLPYAALSDPPPKPTAGERQSVRSRLGISPATRVIGYSFAAASNYQRKNPEAAIDAFEAAFPDDDASAVLILRCHDLEYFPAQRASLLARIGASPRIRLFAHDNRLPINDFYAAIDIYLSTSRAEGYGLNLVEAAQAGIPVVTTGWRLAPEIAALPLVHAVGYDLIPVVDPQSQYTNIPGARWAEPRRDEMVAQIRALCASLQDQPIGSQPKQAAKES